MVVFWIIIVAGISLFGYSVGAVIRSGKSGDLKPKGVDLVFIGIIWLCAIYSILVLDWGKVFAILVWFGFSVLEGIFLFEPSKVVLKDTAKTSVKSHSSILGRLWNRIKGFMNKVGSFQGRMILSLFFFVIVMPVALMVKWLADPLRIKKKKVRDSHWFMREQMPNNSSWFRGQF